MRGAMLQRANKQEQIKLTKKQEPIKDTTIINFFLVFYIYCDAMLSTGTPRSRRPQGKSRMLTAGTPSNRRTLSNPRALGYLQRWMAISRRLHERNVSKKTLAAVWEEILAREHPG